MGFFFHLYFFHHLCAWLKITFADGSMSISLSFLSIHLQPHVLQSHFLAFFSFLLQIVCVTAVNLFSSHLFGLQSPCIEPIWIEYWKCMHQIHITRFSFCWFHHLSNEQNVGHLEITWNKLSNRPHHKVIRGFSMFHNTNNSFMHT